MGGFNRLLIYKTGPPAANHHGAPAWNAAPRPNGSGHRASEATHPPTGDGASGPPLQRAAFAMAANIYVLTLWTTSSWNYADAASRLHSEQ